MSEPQKRGRGRPPKLDRQAALRDAMTLFWENGYEGTTFDDLIGKMRISPSSFYNAFGSKEGLYREATECFLENSRRWIIDRLSEEGVDTRTAFANLFETVAAEFTRQDMPRGCMVSLSGTHQAASLASLREMMVDIRAGTEVRFAERLRKGISDGDVPADFDVDGHAAFLHTLLRGMAVQARDGADREKLVRIAKAGLEGMPGRLSA